MLNHQKQKLSSGFTLIELLVVIAIIGVLAAIVLVSINNARTKAKDVRRKADISQIQKALELYYDDNRQYPTSGGSTAPGANWNTSNDASWTTLQTALQPYMAKLPIDPKQDASGWPGGTNYAYSYSSYSATASCNRQWYALVSRLETAQGPDNGVTACDATVYQYGGTGANTQIKTVGARAK